MPAFHGSSKRMTWKRHIILIFSMTSLTLLTLEIGLRGYDAFQGRSFWKTYGNILAEPIKLFPFRTFGFDLYKTVDGQTYISSRHKELYPVKKPSNTFRIVCIGGSTTENLVEGVHYPKALESRLKERLGRDNIEVINLGNSAYATPHFIILLALDVVSWNPDLVILSENVNDLAATYFPNFTYDYSNKYSNPFFFPDYASRFTIPNVLFQHSRLYWFIYHRLHKNPTYSVQRKSYGYVPSPVSSAVFKRNLQSFVTLAQGNGIPVLLASQPLHPSEEYFVNHMAYKPYNDIAVYPLQGEFVSHHRYYNTIIEEVAAETKSFYLDNDAILRGETDYFVDPVHYTRKGVEQLAENYANYIIKHNIITSHQRQSVVSSLQNNTN
ncbi:MAG: SGNH/GDSL hydrolase family protein [Nitrospira sp. BO4]|jgi:lysophospholipase L1-like esterase|nr:SGNH/GDSL hydrolase family protein [Nitrospira sp. BO4]